MAIMREGEKASKIEAEQLVKRVHELEQDLEELKSKQKDELSDRKRMEDALRNEVMILRKEHGEAVQLPKDMKYHSVHSEELLPKLNNAMSFLLKTMDEIGSAKIRISKDSIKRLSNHVDQVKTMIAKVEVSIEEDKVQIESIVQKYDNSIKSYQIQNEELSRKLKLSHEDLQKNYEKKSEEVKKAKQSEFEILSKYNSLKGRYTQLHSQLEEFKTKAAEEKTKSQETEAWLIGEVNRLEKQQCGVETSGSSPKKDDKKKVRMSYQHGVSKEDVEVRLKDDDESSSSAPSNNSNQFVRALRKEIESLKVQLEKSEDEVKGMKSHADNLEAEAKALKEERDRERKLRALSVKHSETNSDKEEEKEEEEDDISNIPSPNKVSTSSSTQGSYPLESIKEEELLNLSPSEFVSSNESSEEWKQGFSLGHSEESTSHISEEIITSMVAFDEATQSSV